MLGCKYSCLSSSPFHDLIPAHSTIAITRVSQSRGVQWAGLDVKRKYVYRNIGLVCLLDSMFSLD